MSLIDIF